MAMTTIVSVEIIQFCKILALFRTLNYHVNGTDMAKPKVQSASFESSILHFFFSFLL